jgi:hypothetical protein
VVKKKAPIELARVSFAVDPFSRVIDADTKLEWALRELTWTGSVADYLRGLTVELARSRADAVHVAERKRSEQRRRVD